MKSIFAGKFVQESAIEAALELYGVDAPTAVAHCALDAYVDRREADHEFWFRIFRPSEGHSTVREHALKPLSQLRKHQRYPAAPARPTTGRSDPP
ncbi:hypothetical protein CDO22_34300 (plasmid) [Sinorhizobium meliloti]|nr:hypothetical protein CDO22_34300 [Sinorhizobium meliloti]